MPKKLRHHDLGGLRERLERLPRPYDLAARSPSLSTSGSTWGDEYLRLADEAIERLRAEDQPYVVDKALRQTETCLLCLEDVTGGHLTVLHPALREEQDIPYVALHTMTDHGSASYRGARGDGTVDIESLERLVAHKASLRG